MDNSNRSTLAAVLFISLVAVSSVSCTQEKSSNYNEITKSQISEIISDSLNLVFITTEWCSASNNILKNSYTKLCDSLSGKINIVILCASETDSIFSKKLAELDIKCSYYILPNKQSHEKLVEHADRKRIRHFIKNNLKGYDNLNLSWQFGVPVSLFVNKELKIIEKAPQQFKDLRKVILGKE